MRTNASTKNDRTRLCQRQRRAAKHILAAIGIYIFAALTIAPVTTVDGGFFAEIALQPIPCSLIAVAMLLILRATLIRLRYDDDSHESTRGT